MDIEEAQKLLARSVAERRAWREEARETSPSRRGTSARGGHSAYRRGPGAADTFNSIGPIVDAHRGARSQQPPGGELHRPAGGASGVNEVLTAAAPDLMAQAEVANLNASTALNTAQTDKTRAQTAGQT